MFAHRSLHQAVSVTLSIAFVFLPAWAQATNYNWDPAMNLSNSGGAGVWDLTSTFWNNAGTDVVWNNTTGDVAIFGGTGGVVTITTGAGVTANGLTFNVTGYDIAGATGTDVLTLGGTTPTVTVTNSGDTATISAILAGTGWTKAGAGTLILSHASNTYSGDVSITGGTLSISATGQLTAGGALNISNNSSLAVTGNVTTNRVITAGAGGANVNVSGGNTLTLSSALAANANALTVLGGGTVSLANANNASRTGDLTISGAGTKVSGNLSSTVNPFGTGTINLSGATLDLTPTANTATAGLSGRTFTSSISDTARIDFTQTATGVRTDTTINATSTGGAPLPAPAAIQWIGKLKITNSGSYAFQIASDDGSRLYVDGVLVVQNDGPKGELPGTSTFLNLSSGLHDIRMDFVNSGGNGAARLKYASTAASGFDVGTTQTIIPSSVLFTAESNTTGASSNAVILGTGVGNALNVSGASTINLNGGDFTQVQVGNTAFANSSTLNLVTSAGVNGKALRIGGTATFGTGVALNLVGDGTNGANLYVDGVVSDGGVATTITKTGNGNLFFGQTSSANSLLAGTTLDIQAGTLTLVGSSAAGAFNPIGSAGVQLSGGNLVLDSKIGSATVATAFANNITVTQDATIQDIVTGGSLTTLSGAISVAAGKTLTLDAIKGGNPATSLGASLIVSGSLSGPGALNVTSTGVGTLYSDIGGTTVFTTTPSGIIVLNGANGGFTGTTTVGATGVLQVNTTGALNSSAIVLNGGTVNLINDGSGTGANETIAYGNSVTLTAASSIGVNRLGTTYAPLFATPSNKSVQLNALTTGGFGLTVNNSNGYGLNVSGTTTLSGAESFTVSTTTNSSPGIVQGLTLSGQTTGTASSFTKAGTGTMVLDNATNDFTGNITVTGGVLGATSDAALGNAANTITLNGASGAFEAFESFTTSRTFAFANATTANNIISVAGGKTLTLNSALSGANGFQKGDPGVLAIGVNNSPALTGAITASGGILRISNSGALGTGAVTVAANQGTALQLDGSGGALNVANGITINSTGIDTKGALQNIAGTNTLSGTLTVGTASAAVGADAGTTLNLTNITGAALLLNLTGAGTGNINGIITSTGGVQKLGTGTWSITGANTAFSGPVNLLQGTLTFSGSGKYTGTGTPIIAQGTTLVLDNSGTNVNNRLNGRLSNTWFAGELRIIGNSGVDTLENTGGAANFTPSNAGGVVTLVPDAAKGIVFGGATTFPLSRSGTATLLFRAPGLGTVPLATPTAGVGAIGFSGGTGFTGQSGAAGTANRGIWPYALADATATGFGTAFVTYDATNGIRPLGQVAGETVATLTTNANVRASSALTAPVANTTINSLTLDASGGVTLPNGASLLLDSGALLALDGNAGISGGANTTLAGTAGKELIFHVVHPTGGAASLNVGPALTGTAGLIKADNGTLMLSGKSYVTGAATVNGGTLQLNSGTNTLLPNQGLTLNVNGAFDLNGNSQYVGTLQTTATGGNEAVQYGGTLQNTGAAATFVTQMGGNGTFAGTITGGNLYFARTGGNTLTLTRNNDYTGATLLAGGTTTLQDEGRLSGTSAIGINLATLLIKNDGLANNNDRVNDAATVTLRTGQVQFKNRAQTNSFEQLGALVLAQGNNEINVGSATGTGINSAELRFGNISQSAAAYNGGTGLDATTNVQNATGQLGSTTRLFFANGVSLVQNNILPVWIEAGGGEFMTYNAQQGAMALSAAGAAGYTGTTLPTVNNLTSQTGNYRIGASGVVPAGGLTVNTLNINGAFNVTFGTATDVLNIAASGLMKTGTTGTAIGSVVDEGRLTAGGASPVGTVPLHLFNGVNGTSFTINSRIVDNGASPIRLIVNNYNGGTTAVTNGANSYTGGTVVNGWNGNGGGGLSLTGGAGQVVIPAGGLTINNSTVTMVTNSGQIAPTNDVYLNGNATLTLVGANTLKSLNFANEGGTANPTVNTGGVLTLGAGGSINATSANPASVSTIAGTLDLNGSVRTVAVDPVTINGAAVAPFTASLNISAIVQNGGINKTGAGNLQLSGQGTFAGGVNLTNGGLIIGANSTPASAAVVTGPLGTGTLTAAPGTTLLSSGAFTVGNPLVLQGNLNFDGLNNVTFNGATTLPVAPVTINVNAPQQTAALVGSTFVNPTTAITKTGLGTLALSTAYQGTVTMAGGPIAFLDDGDGTGSLETLNAGSVISSGATTVTVGRVGTTFAPYYSTASNKMIQLANLNVNGNALTVNNNNGYGLEVAGTTTLTGGDQIANVATATASNRVQGLKLSGQVTGAFGLVKQGAGTLELTNATNNFGGVGKVIDIQGGIVAASSDAALGDLNNSINLNIAGTSSVGFRSTGTFSTARTFNFAQATNGIEVTAGNTLTLTSPFTGTSATTALVKNDNGTLELNANNSGWTAGTYTLGGAQAGGIIVNAGTLKLTNSNAAGAAANPIVVYTTTGAGVEVAGGVTMANPLTLNHTTGNTYAGGFNWSGTLRSTSGTNTWSGNIQENQDSGISAEAGSILNITGTVTQNAHILVYGGAGLINLQGATLTNHSLDKIGSGTLDIQANVAAPTGNGIRVYAGTMKFSGAAGTVSGAGTLATIVRPGGTLTLDSSGTAVSSRLGGRVMTLVGGNVNLIGNSVTAVTEAIGAPAFNRGQTTITVTDGGAGTNLTFSAASNNVNPAQTTGGSMGTVLFRGTNLGTTAGAGVSTIQWTAGGITFNGQAGAAGTTNKAITPWAIIDSSPTGLGFSFATADTNLGILRPLNTTEYSNTAALVANTNTLLNTASGSLSNQATTSPNSLTFDDSTTLSMAPTATLTLSSGGILVRNGSTSSISGGIASQPAANSAWNIHTVGTGALTISSLMTGGNANSTGGLVKAGGGTLTLSTPTATIGGLTALSRNTLNMQSVVNQGTLVLNGGTNTLGTNNYLEVGTTGTLDLNGTSQYVLGLYTDGTYNGIANTVTAGGTITSTAAATLVTNTDARDWAGTITGNVAFSKGGNNTMTVYTPQTYTGPTQIVTGTVSLRDYGAITGTSGIALNYASLTLDNTGAANMSGRLGGVPLTLRGGLLTYNGRAQTASTESIGAVSLAQGWNQINAAAGGTGVNSADLTLASLTRPVGSNAVVNFANGGTATINGQIGSGQPRVMVTAAPTLTNNLIGPWAIAAREWASYIPDLGIGQLNATGFAGYAATTLATGSATDNIRITGGVTLTANSTVYTLANRYTATNTIDLGGNTLTLTGGGLMLATGNDNTTATISNGTITSGTVGVGGDLYLYHLPYAGANRQSVISAVVANNGGGAVRLIVNSSEGVGSANAVTLSGANTYTGGTVLNQGTLAVSATGVIPAGGVTLNGGALLQNAGGTINTANVLTLNGTATAAFANDNTIAGLVFNNTGGATAPSVTSFRAGVGTMGNGVLTIGASGITATSGNVSTTSIINGRIDMGGSPNTITVDPIMYNGANVAPLQATLAIQGLTGSSGGITKAGLGVLQFNSQANFTGTLSVTGGGINFGTLGNTGLAAGNAAGSRYARVDLAANTWMNLTNTDATIGSLSGAGNVINTTLSGAVPGGRTLNVGFDGTSSTFSGSFARWSDVLVNPYQVNKIGAGTMTLTGVSTTTNNLQVSQGGVTFSGAGTGVFGTTIVLPTGTLTLDNSTTNANNRLTGGLGTGGTLQLSGGTLRMIGNATAATSETIGTLSLVATTNPGGPATITLEPNAAQPLTLTVGTSWGGLGLTTGLIRGVSATAGNGLGNLSIGALGLGAPTGAGTGANGTTTMPIRPDLLGDTSASGTGTGFITKDTVTNFLRPLTAGEMASSAAFTGGLSAGTTNYGLSADTKVGAQQQLGSLALNALGALTLPSHLQVGTPAGLPINPQIVSGGILAQTGNLGIDVGRLQTANNTAFYIHTVGNLSLTGVLNGTTGGLVKAGAGTLTLNSRAVYTGQTNITGGTLLLNGGENTLPLFITGGAPTALSTGVHAGSLDLNGNNQIIATLFNNGLARYADNGGSFTNSSVTAATLTTNAGAQVFGGSITGNLNFTKTGNNALTLTSGNSYSGVTTVRANTLTLLDAGSLANTSAINLNFGGLSIDQSGLNPIGNPNPQRVPAAAPMNLSGGTLTFTANAAGSADYAQTINTVNVNAGANTISVPVPAVSSTSALSLGNLVLNADATLNLTGSGTGFFSTTPGQGASSALYITQINGVNIPANITNKILNANIITANGEFTTYIQSGTTGSTFNWGVATMNSTTGAAQSQYDATTIAAGSNPTQNVRISGTGTQTIGAGGATINALAVRAALTQLAFTAATDPLNLASGGLALTNGGTAVGTTALRGVLTAGGTNTGTQRLYVHSAGTANTINSVIANNASGGVVRLVVDAIANQLNLSAPNTYTGGTVLNGNGGGVTLTGAAAVTVIPAGGLTLNNITLTASAQAGAIAAANDVTLNGSSTLTLGGSNTLNSLTFNNIGGITNPSVATATNLTLSATNAITAVNDNVATVPTISGTLLTLPSGANINASGLAPTDLVISAPMASAGALNKTGAGVLMLSGASTFTGGFNLNNGTLMFGVGSTGTPPAITNGPVGTGPLAIADGTALLSDSAVRTIGNAVTVNGNFTFGTLSGADGSAVAVNGVTLSGAVALGSSVNRTITVNSFLNTSTMSGIISGTGSSLTKAGPGTLVLTGANTYDGGTNLNAGTLQVDADGLPASGSVLFGGGVLQHAASTTTDFSSKFSTANNQPIFIDTNSNNVTYATALTSATGGSLGKFGAGTLILTATANYDGATTINAGTLQVGNGGTIGLIPLGTTIYDGGTLAWNRSDTQTFTGTLTGTGGLTMDRGTLIPTNSITLGGALTFGTSNAVTTVGTLDLSNADATFGSMVSQYFTAATTPTAAVTLPAGRTLNISGNVTIGLDAPASNPNSTVVLGTGGAFVQNAPGGSLTVGTRTQNVNQPTVGTLDLTGLASATINVANVNLGLVTNGSVSAATTSGFLKLAPSTSLTATTQILIGDSGSTGNTGATSTLTAGSGANTLATPLIIVGGRKSNGRIDIAAGGTLTINNGVNKTDLYVTRNNLNTGTGITATFDMTGGTLIANLGTLTVGEKTGGGTGTATATFTLGTSALSSVSIDNLVIGNTSGGGTATGTVNLNGGTVTMGATGGGITDGTGTSTLTLNGATLEMSGKNIGSATSLIDTLNFQSGALQNVAQINNGAGLTKTTAGTLTLAGTNTYTGTTNANAGILLIGSVLGLPGGIGATGGTSGLAINGGVVGLGSGDFTRALGTGVDQVQFTSAGGFAAFAADRAVNLGGASAGVTWGTGSFVPSGQALILGAATATHTVDFQNPIDVTGADRTFQVDNGAAAVDAKISGAITGTSGIVKTGAGTLNLTATGTYTGNTTVSQGALTTTEVNGPGSTTVAQNAQLTSDRIIQAGLTLQGSAGNTSGLTTIRTSGSNAQGANSGASHVNTLAINNDGAALGTRGYYATLDLKNNDLVIDNTTPANDSSPTLSELANVSDMVRSGATGAWTGKGITSSYIATQTPNLNNGTALGTIRNVLDPTAAFGGGNTALYPTFDGYTLPGNETLVKYTWYGDADLDGKLTSFDFALLDAGFAGTKQLDNSSGWFFGDFDYNGLVDANDYASMNAGYIAYTTGGGTPAVPANSQLPEPSTLVLGGLGLIGLLTAYRRRRPTGK